MHRGKISGYFLRTVCVVLGASILVFWVDRSWYAFGEEGFRNAVKAMEKDLVEQVTFCAIGGGAELFQYYSEKQISVPRSWEEFQDIVGKNGEMRCAYRRRPWEPSHHTKIGEFLQENAVSHQHQNVTVFIYGR